jgi:hypothetical protein
MSIAVRYERFILTANQICGIILATFLAKDKLEPAEVPSGGGF